MKAERKGSGGRGDIASLANMVVCVVGALLFLVLTWYSLRYTDYIVLGGFERVTVVPDSAAANLVALAIALALAAVLFVLNGRVRPDILKKVMYVSVAFAVLWVVFHGYRWITAFDRVPEGDQAFVYGGASYFLEGNYSFLGKKGYCRQCPHQLTLIALVELFFLFVGKYNYFAFQVLCTLIAGGIVWLGYRLLWEMTQNCCVVIFYSVLMTCCLPLIFYCSWVYGDLPSIFFMLAAAVMLLHYEKTGHMRWLVGIAPMVTLAVMFRRNSVILVIALCLVGGVYMLQKKDFKMLVGLVLAVLCPVLACAGVTKMYELRSGIPHAGGMSNWSYLAMGMQEADGNCGWYTMYCANVYRRLDYDTDLATMASKQDIRERVEEFRADPAYTFRFYREKILSQWNQPLYESMYFAHKFYPPETDEQRAYVTKVRETVFDGYLAFSDRIHFIIFVGTVLYFVFCVRRKSSILQHLLAVTLIGGFFFSIIWEAKARYILVYYITMFPMAAAGYWAMMQTAAQMLAAFRERGRAGKEPARRAA